MTTEEALLTFQGERTCHDGKCDLECHACTAFMVRGEVLQALAPIIEKGLRAAYSKGHLHGWSKWGEQGDRGVTAGVAAMMEQS